MGDCSVFSTLTLSPARHYADTFIKTVGALWRGGPECRARDSRPSGVGSATRRERAAVDLRYRGDLDHVVWGFSGGSCFLSFYPSPPFFFFSRPHFFLFYPQTTSQMVSTHFLPKF